MSFETTEWFYHVVNGVIDDPAPYRRPTMYGDNDPDSFLAANGDWRLWVDDPGPAGEFQKKMQGIPAPNESESRVERVDTLQDWTSDEIRGSKKNDILRQVPENATVENTRTQFMEPELVRYASEANSKMVDLENTTDQDVPGFDPTLDMTSDRSGQRNSRFSINIRELQPWVGQPSNIYGWVAGLTMEQDQAAVGAEARVIVKSAPSDVGAVIPMVQDASDPTIWRAEARDGHKWADPTTPASIQLLWGAGSLPTSPVITSNGLNDRHSVVTMYAEPV